MPAATGACWPHIARLLGHVVLGRRRDRQKFAGEAGFACRGGEQAVVADAMEPARQDVKQEAADELVGRKCHDALPLPAVAPVILVAEGHAGFVEGEQPPVRDGDTVRVAREIGEHRLGAGEGRLGVDGPTLLADRREVTKEGSPLGKGCEAAEEGKPACVVQG
jgi:hypothetical protein